MRGKTSTQRRIESAARRYRLAPFAMRACNSCSSRGVPCRIGKEHLECEQCFRHNRKCDLSLDYKEMDKASRNVEKLGDEILDMRIKLARVEKQRRYWLKRLKDLGDQESANILEIEADEVPEEPSSSLDMPVALPDFTNDQLNELIAWTPDVSMLEGVSHS